MNALSLSFRVVLFSTMCFLGCLSQSFSQEASSLSYFDPFFLTELKETDCSSLELHRKEFHSFLGTLKAQISRKKNTRQVNQLYEAIHQKYLQQYVENPTFNVLFLKGEYNCVTATALFAMALDYFDIPYEIREMPSHVYLMVYPGSEKMIFETTDPNGGVRKIKTKWIEQYRRYLVANQLISGGEASREDFFETHYLSDKQISMEQLLAVLHYNMAIRLSEEEKYQSALAHAEEAYHYYQADYIKVILHVCLVMWLADEEASIPAKALCEAFTRLLTDDNLTEGKESIYLELYAAKLDALNKHAAGAATLDSLTNCLQQHLPESSLKEMIVKASWLYLSEYYYTVSDFRQALSLLEKAYEPGDDYLKLVIKDCLGRLLDGIPGNEEGMRTMDKYEAIFPFLRNDPQIQGYRVWYYMGIVHYFFHLDEAEEGMRYLEAFRSKYHPEDEVYYHTEIIGNGFGAASAYQVRQQEYDQARALLQEGLKYAPECAELKRKLKYLEDL